MLSVLIYEPDERRRDAVCQTLTQLPGAGAALKINLSTGSASSFSRMVEETGGAMLVVLGLSLRPSDNRRRCLELGNALTRQNRDCYAVYDIYDLEDLPALLPRCARPAGILLGEYNPAQAAACFGRIVEEYIALTSQDASEDAILVESGSATYRLPYSQILYIEALNKKLNICTLRQSVSVRRSMGSISESLPEGFLRCHRSYIVNLRHVDSTDYREMLVTLTDGSRLPIARSMKDAFQEEFSRWMGGNS